MGRSGCGKSTLIECLAGRRNKGLSGRRWLSVNGRESIEPSTSSQSEVKVSLVPQEDSLNRYLTVQESIIFASRLKNIWQGREKHLKTAYVLMNLLDLERCSDVKLASCSGGQCKRLSIALELIGRPNVLLLDEPTSGLDSSSAVQVIQLMRNLVDLKSNPLAIISSIHQPSARLLNNFDSIYLLSQNGGCIYNDKADMLVQTLNRFGLECPQFHNPADFALEVSSGEHGEDVVIAMAAEQKENDLKEEAEFNSATKFQLEFIGVQKASKKSYSFIASLWQTYILVERQMLMNLRDPIFFFTRMLLHLMVGIFLAAIFPNRIGTTDGCYNASRPAPVANRMEAEEIRDVSQNVSYLFFCFFGMSIGAISITVVSYANDLKTMLKEEGNGWYSAGTFYVAKLFSDFPFLLASAIIFTGISYIYTGQSPVFWRYILFTLIVVLCSFVAESTPILLSILFPNHTNANLFSSCFSVFPIALLSGFFVPVNDMNLWLRKLSSGAYIKHAWEGAVIVIYGYDRCEEYTRSEYSNNIHPEISKIKMSLLCGIAINNLTYNSYCDPRFFNDLLEVRMNETGFRNGDSTILKFMELEDSDLLENIGILLTYAFVQRLFNYIVLVAKMKWVN